MIERLQKLKDARSQYPNNGVLATAIKEDNAFRNEIDQLAQYFLKRKLAGCSNCITDAYLELISLNMEKAIKIDECKFRLRAGAVLYDRETADKRYLCSNHNLTNELALYHLNRYPSLKDLFDVIPDNLDELLAEYNGEGKKEVKQPKKRTKKQ